MDFTGFTDKDSKREEYRRLYQGADYVEAYSRHTDLRIRNDGPAQAIGGDWENHGLLQLEFLKRRGLKPTSRFLDLGCGTGRLARRVVPYLDAGKYVGLDISAGALAYASDLSVDEGWADKRPRFLLGDGTLRAVEGMPFDIIWAHSVCTHLPQNLIEGLFVGLASMEFGEFYFTYKRRPVAKRTGLKQFGYPFSFFEYMARSVGLKAEELPDKWPQGQSCGRVWW